VSEVPPTDPPLGVDPAADARAAADRSPLLEKFDALMRIGSAIAAALFLLRVLLPMDGDGEGKPTWIWDPNFPPAYWTFDDPAMLLEPTHLFFPIMQVPLLLIAAGSKRSPVRLFVLLIAALLQFGPPAMNVILISIYPGTGMDRKEAALLVGLFGLLTASAGCSGLAMGTRRDAWRRAAGLGGALLALTSYLSLVMTLPHYRMTTAGSFLLRLTPLAGLLAGGAGIAAALSLERRVSYAKACLLGTSGAVFCLGIFFLTRGIGRSAADLIVPLHFCIRTLAGCLLGWLFLTAMLQSFSPMEEAATE
jgi:hypothetical protein